MTRNQRRDKLILDLEEARRDLQNIQDSIKENPNTVNVTIVVAAEYPVFFPMVDEVTNLIAELDNWLVKTPKNFLALPKFESMRESIKTLSEVKTLLHGLENMEYEDLSIYREENEELLVTLCKLTRDASTAIQLLARVEFPKFADGRK